jgi:hypothetical protein
MSDKPEKPSKPPIVLTPEQRKLIEDNYFLNIRELVQLVFNDPKLTLRNDAEVKAVKLALADAGKHVNAPPTPKEEELLITLTEEHKEYIRNNIRDANSALEIARTIFDNEKLLPSSKQCQAVQLYCKQIDPNYRKDEEIAADLEYSPPKSAIHLIGRINRYAVNKSGSGKTLFDASCLTSAQTQQLECLFSYMRMPLFKVEADKFVRRIDRDVFESTFISNCWDKPDLDSAHVVQFIQLSSMIVKYNQIDRMMQKVDQRVSTVLEDETPLKMNDVDALNALQEKGTAAMKQINALIKSLMTERSKMTDEKRAGNASMHNLVDAWKRREDRRKIIQLAERKQKAALKQEVERQSSMDSLKVEIFGISKSDILL